MSNKCRISVLDEQTINQIAAGEVIENSGSVIKELVENSIDAGATEICVETQGGGRALIRVSDNGCGMSQEELLLSIQRHATSKILKSDDLERICSLGFRGEALPSIASVSKMVLKSEVQIEVEGGKVLAIHPKSVDGTIIEVRSLFFNTPVRRKFQKSIAADVAAIHKMLIQLALCHPALQIKWIHEGEERLFVEEKRELEERVEELLGKEFTGKELIASSDQIQLRGFVGGHRANRTGQYLFVNGRFVVSPFLSQAVLEGCGTRIPAGRFPQFVLHLTLPTDWIDVNVHPQKREVRFREKERVGDFVRSEVDRALQVQPPPIRFDPPRVCISTEKIDLEPVEEFIVKRKEETPVAELDLSFSLDCLGVVGAYLLINCESGIGVIDLNRARSLLLGERIEEVGMQKLLIPLMLDFDHPDIVTEKMEFLERCGFSLRPFGGRSFACEAIPAHIDQEEARTVIEELLAGRKKLMTLRRRRFTLEEAKRIGEELFSKGIEKEALSILTEEELAKRFAH